MGLLGQNQKGGLKRVLDVVLALEHSPAGGQDHGPMTGDQGLKSDGVVRVGITGQKLPVPQSRGRPHAEKVAKVPQGRPQTRACHAIGPLGRTYPARPVPHLRGKSS